LQIIAAIDDPPGNLGAFVYCPVNRTHDPIARLSITDP
jgi:hypothetical protein